jgi:hypothetical protein
MNAPAEQRVSANTTSAQRRIGVHILSEHVFCPMAAVMALESNKFDGGDDDSPRGPRLDGYYDYDEHRFSEAIANTWSEIRRWLTWVAPALLLSFAAWQFHSLAAGAVLLLPALVIAALLLDAITRLVRHVRTQAIYRAAPRAEVSMNPERVTEVNWWTLRKAGFDCLKPFDAYVDSQLIGRPWRLLVKDTMWRIPVIRKHRGEKVYGRQHIVRAAAYCRLIESSEGGRAPFAVMLFANSFDCLIIPNGTASRADLERALGEVGEFLDVYDRQRFIPSEPTDNRCSGCPWGRPVRFAEQTVLNDREVAPIRIEGIAKGDFHCFCGDRFNFVPKHKDIARLRGG